MKPVIGSRHGGIPEIIDHDETGFLVPERDSDSIAFYLSRLLTDDRLRINMGQNGRLKMTREYDIVNRVAALEKHYDEVIEAHKSRCCLP